MLCLAQEFGVQPQKINYLDKKPNISVKCEILYRRLLLQKL